MRLAKKIFFIIGIIFLIFIAVIFSIDNLSSDCPSYIFNDVDFEIINEKGNNYNIELEETKVLDSTKFTSSNYLILYPKFLPIHDTTSRPLNICAGPKEIEGDSILDIRLFLIEQGDPVDITNRLTPTNSKLRISQNGNDVSTGEDISYFINFYNDCCSGHGDFYPKNFENWGFVLSLENLMMANDKIKFELFIKFSSGRIITKQKEISKERLIFSKS